MSDAILCRANDASHHRETQAREYDFGKTALIRRMESGNGCKELEPWDQHQREGQRCCQREDQKIERDARLATASRQLSDVAQTIQNNKLRIASMELSAKGHLQALIMQYFGTRRFEHVIIANRFYPGNLHGRRQLDRDLQKDGGYPARNKDAGQAKISAELNPQVSATEGVIDSDAEAGAGMNGNGTKVNVYNGTPRTRSGSSFAAKGAKLGMENFGVESLTGGAGNRSSNHQQTCELVEPDRQPCERGDPGCQ
jgi:hypothetical protein